MGTAEIGGVIDLLMLRAEEMSVGLDPVFVPVGTVESSAAVHCWEKLATRFGVKKVLRHHGSQTEFYRYG